MVRTIFLGLSAGALALGVALAQESPVPVIGMPASIDHDVGCTGTAIGVDTALNTIVSSCIRQCSLFDQSVFL